MDPLKDWPASSDFRPTERAAAVYLHIPFCDVRCPYCHFYCFVNRDASLPLRYVRAMAREFQLWERRGLVADELRSVYLGGGTPSALPPEARKWLCDWLGAEIRPRLSESAELTLEANPESAWPEVLRDWIGAGINRISLGVQSMDAGVLRFLGRLNTPASNRRALALACGLVERVSADLIVASPRDSWRSLADGIDTILESGVQHISAYLLEIHPTTRFGRDVAKRRWAPRPDPEQEELYLQLVDALRTRGLIAYELSNFARPGHESRHNQAYWRRESYLGLGSSAHSFADSLRWANVSDAQRYCEAIEAEAPALELFEALDPEQVRAECVLLGLRTRQGIPQAWLPQRRELCEELARAGLLRLDGERVRLTPRGWLILDEIVARLVD